MSTVVTYNGTQYTVPAYQDTGYAQGNGNLAQYLIALATGSLNLAGGNFTLTADVNFGPSFGLVSLYYKSRTANLAAAGQIRLANTDTINWRNAANNADVALSVNGSNALLFAGTALLTGVGTGLTLTGSSVSLTAPVTIALGGTNSTAALANGLLMTSVGGAIVEIGANVSANSKKITSLANGTAAQDAAAFGQLKVIQTVTVTSTASTATSSGTFAVTGLTLSITPTSASNRILILVSGEWGASTNNAGTSVATIFRAGSNILSANGFALLQSNYAAAGSLRAGVAGHYIDSPATTGATTYDVRVNNNNSQTVTWNDNSSTASLTLMEIV